MNKHIYIFTTVKEMTDQVELKGTLVLSYITGNTTEDIHAHTNGFFLMGLLLSVVAQWCSRLQVSLQQQHTRPAAV